VKSMEAEITTATEQLKHIGLRFGISQLQHSWLTSPFPYEWKFRDRNGAIRRIALTSADILQLAIMPEPIQTEFLEVKLRPVIGREEAHC
jgi:hypothetical protein